MRSINLGIKGNSLLVRESVNTISLLLQHTMSANQLLQLSLDKAQAVFSQLPPGVQGFLANPITRKAILLVTAYKLLKGVNSYLSQQVQNNWVRARPWNPQKELAVITGGSSGIGKQIMHDLTKLNVKIVIYDIQEPTFALRESSLPTITTTHSWHRQADHLSTERLLLQSRPHLLRCNQRGSHTDTQRARPSHNPNQQRRRRLRGIDPGGARSEDPADAGSQHARPFLDRQGVPP